MSTDDTAYAMDTPVQARTGKVRGRLTGVSRACQLEGCLGRRLGVRWPDGKLTWPCTKGMDFDGKRWKIL